MNGIIALQGKGSSGKTTTINMLPAILRANGYRPVPGKYRQHGAGFLDVYENGVIRLGVTSSGDTYDLVHDRLSDLINAGCTVCICACRTRDNVPPGTIAAVNSFPGYIPTFIQKTYATTPAQEPITNAADANSLFNAI
jgi:hypothetical protein